MDVIAQPYRVIFWSVPSVMAVLLVFSLTVCAKADRLRNSRYADEERRPMHPPRSSRPHSRPPPPLQDECYDDDSHANLTSTPYNPNYPAGGGGGHRLSMEQYPIGPQRPPSHGVTQPLMGQDHPPSYDQIVKSNAYYH